MANAVNNDPGRVRPLKDYVRVWNYHEAAEIALLVVRPPFGCSASRSMMPCSRRLTFSAPPRRPGFNVFQNLGHLPKRPARVADFLCPHGADFFVRRELATLGFGQRGVQVRFFFGRELIACSSNRVILENIVLSAPLRKAPTSTGPHGFPIAIAIAAARNGNGTDTAARNQTNRAGMNGISHNSTRWKANSAQAIT
jgi:hypothetical protein